MKLTVLVVNIILIFVVYIVIRIIARIKNGHWYGYNYKKDE